MSNKPNYAKCFTRVEGGKIKPLPFELDEAELKDYKIAETKEVFSHALNAKIKTRVFKINNIYVKALFFEDGKVYDATPIGFKLRQHENGTHIDYTDQIELCK